MCSKYDLNNQVNLCICIQLINASPEINDRQGADTKKHGEKSPFHRVFPTWLSLLVFQRLEVRRTIKYPRLLRRIIVEKSP